MTPLDQQPRGALTISQRSEDGEFGSREFKPGIVLVMLLWGLPLIVLTDVLLLLRAKPV